MPYVKVGLHLHPLSARHAFGCLSPGQLLLHEHALLWLDDFLVREGVISRSVVKERLLRLLFAKINIQPRLTKSIFVTRANFTLKFWLHPSDLQFGSCVLELSSKRLRVGWDISTGVLISQDKSVFGLGSARSFQIKVFVAVVSRVYLLSSADKLGDQLELVKRKGHFLFYGDKIRVC